MPVADTIAAIDRALSAPAAQANAEAMAQFDLATFALAGLTAQLAVDPSDTAAVDDLVRQLYLHLGQGFAARDLYLTGGMTATHTSDGVH